MKYKYYIARRFFLSRHNNYQPRMSLNSEQEVVTLDNILCKKRYFDNKTHEYIGISDSYDQISRFSLTENEQIIRFLNLKSDIILEESNDFDFCGYEILDSFGDNSWVTNYGIEYTNEKYAFTKYGLLPSFTSAIKWINQNKDGHQELQNGEYNICAVWRKVLG